MTKDVVVVMLMVVTCIQISYLSLQVASSSPSPTSTCPHLCPHAFGALNELNYYNNDHELFISYTLYKLRPPHKPLL